MGQASAYGPLAIGAVILNAVAFIAYGIDKSAARRRRRRIPEKVLHALALAGGWPGALLGQTIFRHKTAKRSFQMMFWMTAIANCAAVAGILRLAQNR